MIPISNNEDIRGCTTSDPSGGIYRRLQTIFTKKLIIMAGFPTINKTIRQRISALFNVKDALRQGFLAWKISQTDNQLTKNRFCWLVEGIFFRMIDVDISIQAGSFFASWTHDLCPIREYPQAIKAFGVVRQDIKT